MKIAISTALCILVAVTTFSASAGGSAPEVAESDMKIVGVDILETYSSPNPYPGIAQSGEAQLLWSDIIHHPEASYICPHFSRMELGEGDFVIVRSPDSSRVWRYERNGIDGLGRSEDGFWGIHIAGDTAVVELWSAGNQGGFGYVVDRYAKGFSPKEAEDLGEPEAIIGPDDSEWAPCYQTSDPVVYDKSRAVARLLINGSGLCTGWLVGSEGHLLTNEHCITAQSEASNTNYEFMAEGATCDTSCGQLQCPGTIVTTSGTLIADSPDYDFAFVLLSVNPSSTYGFFTLREGGGVVGERLYIPQHPLGWGKKIALNSTHPGDAGHPKVISTSEGGCLGRPGPDMTYRADTQGGSSGSPVVAHSDHQIIGLHHCGGTVNTGVLVEQVIAALGSSLPASAFTTSTRIFSDGFEVGDTTGWSQTIQ